MEDLAPHVDADGQPLLTREEFAAKIHPILAELPSALRSPVLDLLTSEVPSIEIPPDPPPPDFDRSQLIGQKREYAISKNLRLAVKDQELEALADLALVLVALCTTTAINRQKLCSAVVFAGAVVWRLSRTHHKLTPEQTELLCSLRLVQPKTEPQLASLLRAVGKDHLAGRVPEVLEQLRRSRRADGEVEPLVSKGHDGTWTTAGV